MNTNILNLANDEANYHSLKLEIDQMIAGTSNPADYEARKGEALALNSAYVDFLARGMDVASTVVRPYILELSTDHEFFRWLERGLKTLADSTKRGLQTGEIRVHAHTLYVATRILKPQNMVETGVASGKSSAIILRAMQRNGGGKLWSIDLPVSEASGDVTQEAVIPGTREPGWLVPQELKSLWELRLGDARKLLPHLRQELPLIDVFFHDSLHSYEHMKFELALANEWVRPAGLVLCDDILTNSAFEEESARFTRAAFGTFGIYRLPAQ